MGKAPIKYPIKPVQIPVGSRKQRRFYGKKGVGSFAKELGLFIFEWNRMQEFLGILFGIIATNNKDTQAGQAIWHSSINDGAQREMLKRAIKADPPKMIAAEMPLRITFKKLTEDILWILEQIDEKPNLRNIRNNLIHSPYMIVDGNVVASLWVFGNVKARRLKGKDLLAEVKWGRDCAFVLAEFAWALIGAIAAAQLFSWPSRPTLPAR